MSNSTLVSFTRLSPNNSGKRTAVRNFQSTRGLAVDGVVGAMTWKELIGG